MCTASKGFDCSQCFGICCVNSPLLRTVEEGLIAKKYGASIVASPVEGGFFIAIEKRNDACPFLDRKTGECQIYEERFESCRAYRCGLIGMDPDVVASMLLHMKLDALQMGPKTSRPDPLSRSDIRRIGARIIRKRNKLIQSIAATDVATVAELIASFAVKYAKKRTEKKEDA